MTNDGEYSATTAYTWLQGGNAIFPLFSSFWNRLSVPKHCVIFWLVAHGRLLTKDRLRKWGMANIDPGCVLCGREEETVTSL